jgi:antirestriction protein ArdC
LNEELLVAKMPIIEAFRDAESFYATLAHESTHWTKHPSGLERDFGLKTWGDEGFAREELVLTGEPLMARPTSCHQGCILNLQAEAPQSYLDSGGSVARPARESEGTWRMGESSCHCQLTNNL